MLSVYQAKKKFFVVSSTSSQEFFCSLSHEFAHQIYDKVENQFPEFNMRWDGIKGGVANYYDSEMSKLSSSLLSHARKENVASITEVTVTSFLEGKDVNKIEPFDKENYEAFRAKQRLLKKYGFFPPVIANKIAEN